MYEMKYGELGECFGGNLLSIPPLIHSAMRPRGNIGTPARRKGHDRSIESFISELTIIA
jgi:hypothetical protein